LTVAKYFITGGTRNQFLGYLPDGRLNRAIIEDRPTPRQSHRRYEEEEEEEEEDFV